MVTLLRAAVMLIVLVGLPAGLIFYDQLPVEARTAIGNVVKLGREQLGWETADAAKTQAVPEPNTDDPALWGASVEEQPVTPPPMVPGHEIAEQQHESQAESDLEPLLRQLRGLGVKQYELKTWGEAEQFYRFQCEMPLSEASPLVQQFEAVTVDPHESVAQVVAEIALWHADRQLR